MRATRIASAVVIVAAAVAAPALPGGASRDPLAGFSHSARSSILGGAAVLEVRSASGPAFDVEGIVATSATGADLVARARDIEKLQGGHFVPAIRRFSDVPHTSDLAPLVIHDDELSDLRDCQPRNCDVKLSAAEIAAIRARTDGADWKNRAADAMKEVLLARAHAYLERGLGGMARYEDKKVPIDAGAELQEILRSAAGDPLMTPRVRRYLERFPAEAIDGESFIYWSRDLMGDAKPIVSITHLALFNETETEPAIMAAVQVYASHYLTGSLSLTAVVTDAPTGRRYVRYSRRSRADVFDGAFSGLIRRMVTREVRRAGPPLLDKLRRALERPSN